MQRDNVYELQARSRSYTLSLCMQRFVFYPIGFSSRRYSANEEEFIEYEKAPTSDLSTLCARRYLPSRPVNQG